MVTDKAWVEMSWAERDVRLAALRKKFPTNCRVKVVASDPETEDVYVGKTGKVVNDDGGDETCPPTISVCFDKPHGRVKQDGFYEDEIERI